MKLIANSVFLTAALFAGSATCLFAQDEAAKRAAFTPSDEVVYTLSPFDLVSFSVYGEEDLESRQRISDKGYLSVPLLGDVAVGGLSVADASARIEKEFIQQEYLRKPIVTLSIEEFSPKVVTVLGEVEEPGSIEIPPGRNGIPLQIAIAGAGGLTGTAKVSDVRVTSKTEDGKKIDLKVNLDRLLEARKSDEDQIYYVYPDDIVFVPRRVF